MSYTATDFYNDELRRLQEKQNNASTILNSQGRLAELNDSYRKRYAKYVEILVVLVMAVLIYLAVMALQMQFPVIPQVAVDIVAIVLIFLVVVYLFSAFSELYTRSLLNYDELDVPGYDESGVDISALKAKGQIFEKKGNLNAVCVGADCCPSTMIFDTDLNRCVLGNGNAIAGNTRSGFITRLDYEQLETAYTVVNGTFKREPNANAKPIHGVSALSFSNF